MTSWNDGPAKQAILDFVRATTGQASPKFVPPEDRIATFDQDGTLWVEHPMYTQVLREGADLSALYDEARKDGWTVISMKNDWKLARSASMTPLPNRSTWRLNQLR